MGELASGQDGKDAKGGRKAGLCALLTWFIRGNKRVLYGENANEYAICVLDCWCSTNGWRCQGVSGSIEVEGLQTTPNTALTVATPYTLCSPPPSLYL